MALKIKDINWKVMFYLVYFILLVVLIYIIPYQHMLGDKSFQEATLMSKLKLMSDICLLLSGFAILYYFFCAWLFYNAKGVEK